MRDLYAALHFRMELTYLLILVPFGIALLPAGECKSKVCLLKAIWASTSPSGKYLTLPAAKCLTWLQSTAHLFGFYGLYCRRQLSAVGKNQI